jgi:hypothetical protein
MTLIFATPSLMQTWPAAAGMEINRDGANAPGGLKEDPLDGHFDAFFPDNSPSGDTASVEADLPDLPRRSRGPAVPATVGRGIFGGHGENIINYD